MNDDHLAGPIVKRINQVKGEARRRTEIAAMADEAESVRARRPHQNCEQEDTTGVTNKTVKTPNVGEVIRARRVIDPNMSKTETTAVKERIATETAIAGSMESDEEESARLRSAEDRNTKRRENTKRKAVTNTIAKNNTNNGTVGETAVKDRTTQALTIQTEST